MHDMAIAGFLKTVKEIKKKEVAAHQRRISLASLRRQAEQVPLKTNFLAALKKSTPSDVGIIAEIKKASPSKGDLCLDLDPKVAAAAYESGGARAVSVLTESVYFKGCLADLETAFAATKLPVLRKDFIIHEYQIYEARHAGAGSVLLITTLLSKNQQAEFTSLARELGMEPLVEIASEWEIDQSLAADARMVGINNRNLSTLELDPDAAVRIAPILPREVLPVAASGIFTPQDIQQGIDAGIYNFLVGESIVRAPDPQAFIRSLTQACLK
ncbi:MAG: indole-3-glycerol phosphate synthase TrpC [Desulfotignum sp.]